MWRVLAKRSVNLFSARTVGRFQFNTQSLRCVPIIMRPFSTEKANTEKAKALEDLRNAMSELSRDEEKEDFCVTTGELLEWNNQPLSSLTKQQLEELGSAMFEGIEGELVVNQARAFEIWTEAKNKGSVEGRYCRAVCLRQGTGTEKNVEEAYKEMKAIADESNYGLAHFAAGIMLNAGEGTEQNYELAYHHFNQAALDGLAPALLNMGNAHAAGHGVVKDEAKAARIYEGAATAGDPAAKFILGTWLYRGLGGLTVDKKRSFTLQLEAAEAGHPAAMFNTGAGYMEGAAIPQDFVKAAEWFEKAAALGLAQANTNLGGLYRAGMGVPRDLHKALEIFKRFEHVDTVSAELVQAVKEEIAEEESAAPPPAKSQ